MYFWVSSWISSIVYHTLIFFFFFGNSLSFCLELNLLLKIINWDLTRYHLIFLSPLVHYHSNILKKIVSPTPWKGSYDQPRQHIKKQRHYFANKGPSGQDYGFSSGHVWMWELDCEESWALKNWCFWTVVLEKILESPLDCEETHPVHPKGGQSWVFIGRTDAEAETPILWPSDVKSWLIGKDPDAGKDWGQEEKGTTED